MKNLNLYFLFFCLITGCSSSPKEQLITYADWQYCVEYSHTYDSTISALIDQSTGTIANQILLDDIQKLHDSLIIEDKSNKNLIEYNIRAMKDAIDKKAKASDGDNEVDKSYNYCMATYPEKHIRDMYSQQLLLNIDAGEYKDISLNWKPVGTDCFEITVLSPHFGTKWLPRAYLTYTNKSSDEWGQIYLSPANDTSFLTLQYQSKSSKDEVDLLHNIQYFTPVKVKITYPTEKSLLIEVGEDSYLKRLNFVPDTIKVGASSSESNISILKESHCR